MARLKMHRPQSSALGSGLCTGETQALPFLLQWLIQFPGQGEAGGGDGGLVGGDPPKPCRCPFVGPSWDLSCFFFPLSSSFLPSFMSVPIQTAHSYLNLDRPPGFQKQDRFPYLFREVPQELSEVVYIKH